MAAPIGNASLHGAHDKFLFSADEDEPDSRSVATTQKSKKKLHSHVRKPSSIPGPASTSKETGHRHSSTQAHRSPIRRKDKEVKTFLERHKKETVAKVVKGTCQNAISEIRNEEALASSSKVLLAVMSLIIAIQVLVIQYLLRPTINAQAAVDCRWQLHSCQLGMHRAGVDAAMATNISGASLQRCSEDVTHCLAQLATCRTAVERTSAELQHESSDECRRAKEAGSLTDVGVQLKIHDATHSLKQRNRRLANCYYLYAVVSRQLESTVDDYKKYRSAVLSRQRRRWTPDVLREAFFPPGPSQHWEYRLEQHSVTDEQLKQLAECDREASKALVAL